MSESEPSATATPVEAPQPGLKFLEATVYIMGGLLVLMLVILIGGVTWKALRRGPPEPPAATIVDVPLAAGVTVGAMTLDGDRLAVQTGEGDLREIIVIDTRKGTVISRVRFKPAQ
jgi:hypothetical protein